MESGIYIVPLTRLTEDFYLMFNFVLIFMHSCSSTFSHLEIDVWCLLVI